MPLKLKRLTFALMSITFKSRCGNAAQLTGAAAAAIVAVPATAAVADWQHGLVARLKFIRDN